MSKVNRRMATITAKKEISNPWFKAGWFAGALASAIMLGVTILVFPQLKVMVQEYQKEQRTIDPKATDSKKGEPQKVDSNERTTVSDSSTNDWNIAFESPVDFIDSAELDEFVKARLQMNFFSLDVNEASKVLMQFPWIKQVSARKVWPNTLVVQVEEHQPWLNLNNEALISTEGELFEPSNIESFEELPVLKGRFGKVEDLLSMYQFFSEQMPANDFRITELEFDVIDGWHMKLRNGIDLMIGNKDLADRLDRFLAIIQQLPAQKTEQIKYLDMRYQTGVAVGWRALTDEQIARR